MTQWRLQFSWLSRKGRMGKEKIEQQENNTDEPKLLEQHENSADEPKLLARLTGKVLENLDMHALSDSVADQISEKVASKIQTCDLVDRLLQKYQEEIEAAITEAIVQRL